MYTTRSLSLYKNTPDAISLPPEGPNSSYLVLQDDESTPTFFFGLFKSSAIKALPFPQNKLLTVEYSTNNGKNSSHSYDKIYLIPVVNESLSFNRYYVIKADGNRKGEAYASSKEEDIGTCCFCIPSIKDVKTRTFDPDDIYQQFEFSVTSTWANSNQLVAKSVAADGHPPLFLRRHGWTMSAKTPKNFSLGEANGPDSRLRAHLPDFNFPASEEFSSSSVIGKWYCPFIFVKEKTVKEQIKNSTFYEMTLQQRWKRIFAAQKTYGDQGKVVSVDIVVPTEVVKIGGQEAVQAYRSDGSAGVVWFRTVEGSAADDHLGLSKLIVDRMMWEQERVGWVKGKEDKQVRVVKEEVCTGLADWRSFCCYMLVESFVLKRSDGSIALTYDFMHTHQIRSKWD